MHQPERHRQTRFDALALALAQPLRNALSTITMTLELLREELSGPAPGPGVGVRRVDAALEEIKRLDRVFVDFMRFAHEPDLDVEACDVNRLIEDSLAVVAPGLRAQRVTPVLQLDRRLGPAPLDQRLFRQALICLMDNVAGTMDGGVLTIQTRARPGGVELDVIDTGPGHPPESWARMLDSYFTSMSGRSGVGLGLVRQVVELHRGRIEYEGATGAGNRIRIALPVTGGP